ncbi:hypothetical protein [Desulfovulcanus sp.]
MLKRIFIFCLFAFFLAESYLGHAQPLTKSINLNLSYLLSLSEDPALPLDHKAIESLLTFVLNNQDSSFTLPQRRNMAGAFHQFTLESSLKKILAYGFNPQLPPNILRPSSIRFAYWKKMYNTNGQDLANLWTQVDNLSEPIIFSGLEYEENTPDLFSGGYYGYDLDRIIILMPFGQTKVLISISRQKNKSKLGQKGEIIGPDENWDYFYSEKPGLTKAGLGWVDSYIYKSASIGIYIQTEPDKTKCAFFNWLKAGWMNINFVQPKHILAGLKRFAQGLKTVIHSPNLPTVEDLIKFNQQIRQKTTAELRQELAAYFQQLAVISPCNSLINSKNVQKEFTNGLYLQKINRHYIEALLNLEYLKSCLGKKPRLDLEAHLNTLVKTNLN